MSDDICRPGRHINPPRVGKNRQCGFCVKENQRRWNAANKDKVRASKAKWLRNNKQKRKESSRRYNEKNRDAYYKKLYGIGIEQYEELFLAQDGRCGICGIGQEELKKTLAVDHCHTTSVVRGLLCQECNTGIGKLKHSMALLQNAIDYLVPHATV